MYISGKKHTEFTYCPVLVKTTIAVAIVLMAASTAAMAEACAELHGLFVMPRNSSYTILKCIADSASIAICRKRILDLK